MFTQPPPELGNQFSEDRTLQAYLQERLPKQMYSSIHSELFEMGDLAGNEFYDLQQADRTNEPVLTPWNAWGNRIDKVSITPLWQRAKEVAARFGLVAASYEHEHGRWARVHQFALAYLFYTIH